MASKDEILQSLLNAVPNSYDKKVGSFIYDSLAPVAEQMAGIDDSIVTVKDKLIIDNLSENELAQRVKERTGIGRKEATFAIGVVTVTGTGTINIDDLFETEEGIQFRATETKSITSSGTVNIAAVVSGSVGNVPAQTIKLFPVTLPGFTAVTNANPTEGGFEAESDGELLQRYYERIQTPATSGNKSQYKNWASDVIGVGGAKVFPLWNGDNTVKIVIIDSNKQPASTTLVGNVQNYIDPNSAGLGDGVAPIGAYCTVISAIGLSINISFTATKDPAYTDAQRQANVEQNINDYLKSIAFIESQVSYAKVGALILASEGILDYSNLTINSGTANIPIGNEEVAILGGVTIV
jgi:uncharacterized phage protein gp47/JayE